MATIIGITGSLCSGKSSVASMFARLGAKIVDADKIAHQLIEKHGVCFKRVIDAFGKDILNAQGIDRTKLANIVFKDKNKLKQLEDIIHPAVIKEIKKEIKNFKKTKDGKSVLALDVPLLFEAGLGRLTDFNIVVKASYEDRIKRAVCKLGISRADAVRRIKAQMPLRAKLPLADFVIDNNRSKQDTFSQVKIIWDEIHNKLC